MSSGPMSGEGSGLWIRIEGLTRTYEKGGQKIEVLREVDLIIEPGERVAILGPSGSGKSTFLHILGTLDRPTSGRILFDNKDVFARSRREIDALRNQEIGFVFQSHHLLPEQDARGNVAMPLIIRGQRLADAYEQASEILGRVGLGHRLSHKPGELSGGEQQRVAIARALITRPRLLLADEPTGNLDPRTADGVFDMLLQLNRELGSTLVMVTHSHELAGRLTRRLHVIDGALRPEEQQGAE